jgi:hypothetical protein
MGITPGMSLLFFSISSLTFKDLNALPAIKHIPAFPAV